MTGATSDFAGATEDADEAAIRTPIVDFLYHEPEVRGYVAEFVPQRRVSREQKEGLTVADGSPTARRVAELLAELSAACGTDAPVVKIGHGGGDRFTLFAADGSRVELPAADAGPRLDAYAALQVIATELQFEFARRRGDPACPDEPAAPRAGSGTGGREKTR